MCRRSVFLVIKACSALLDPLLLSLRRCFLVSMAAEVIGQKILGICFMENFGAGGLLSSAEALAEPGSHMSVLHEGIRLAETL